MKFELGKVMMTVGANTKLECTSVAEILLGRYANGDWGNLSDDDKQENEIALKQNYRLLGSYEDANGVSFGLLPKQIEGVQRYCCLRSIDYE